MQKSVWRSSEARDWFSSQAQFWCRALLRLCTKSPHSNHLKRTKIVNWHVIIYFGEKNAPKLQYRRQKEWSRVDSLFWCVLNGSNAHFWCIIEEMLCTKTAFAKQIKHVLLNSFKHFSAPKMVPPRIFRNRRYKIIWDMERSIWRQRIYIWSKLENK